MKRKICRSQRLPTVLATVSCPVSSPSELPTPQALSLREPAGPQEYQDQEIVKRIRVKTRTREE
jgi:hypothetical protein